VALPLELTAERANAMDIPDNVKRALRELPDRPGCYLMRDRSGRIIYVGKARSLRKRVTTYFRDATLRGADPKLRSLVHSVAALEFMELRNEAEALLTESRLIKEYRPRYNVSLRDDKRFLMLRGEAGEPLPRLRVVRFRRDDGADYFGPYVSSPAARATLDFVERRFGLRKCAPREPDAATHRHCLDDIVRFCSAPCIGKVAPEEYRERYRTACAFLRGERPEDLGELRERMRAAAAALDFEQAAMLRDTLRMIERTLRQRARAAPTPEMRRSEALRGVEELGRLLGLPAPPRVIEAFDVSNISGTLAVASLVCAVDGMPHRNRYRRFRIRGVAGPDDPAMMAEAVRRRLRPTTGKAVPLPDLLLMDGGITQLRAARNTIAELGEAGPPCAALAKRFEEVRFADPGPPLRLPADSAALKLLQRLRDEAHRFAVAYHHHLRAAKLRESALDEIEGVGPARKTALLRAFGSVARLARAPELEIAAVPGVGPALARRLHSALNPSAKPAAPPA
jgi:excinuclease ABC subunit C